MKITVCATKEALGERTGTEGATLIADAIAKRGRAAIILATGASQFEMLDQLVRDERVDWSWVEVFHLDEYIDLPLDHPASFGLYLRKRFAERIPRPPIEIHYIQGKGDPYLECRRLEQIINSVTVDVAFVGIGENGHLAFNDPPADFDSEEPFLVVDLDETCRAQQVGEGWFSRLDHVPTRAISMSIKQIMKSRTIICTVPDQRKAAAVQRTLEEPVHPETPASILRRHPDCHLFLDPASASLLKEGYDGAP